MKEVFAKARPDATGQWKKEEGSYEAELNGKDVWFDAAAKLLMKKKHNDYASVKKKP